MPDGLKPGGAEETHDERSIARRYGLRELVYPEGEQVKTFIQFLDESLAARRFGPIPRTTALVILEFLQATVNRQHLTKGPRMSQDEFDVLQAPYYLAARILAKIHRSRQENLKGKTYQTTYLSLNQFIELLRNVVDPASPWVRLKAIPESVAGSMEALREFLSSYPEQRRKGRPL